jgi:hypothetical protein
MTERYLLSDREFWLLHEPYPDKTWRGLAKCCTIPLEEGTLQPVTYGPPYAFPVMVNDAPLLFETAELAEAFAVKHDCVGMVPVRVLLVAPFIRQPLDAVPERVVP